MAAPSMAPTVATTNSADAELSNIEHGLPRLANEALNQHRVTPSRGKSADTSALKIGAKLERALDRRMSSQDAAMRQRT
jgi:hypothetical protein